MGLVLFLLIVFLLLGGFGFAWHLLWVIAVALAIVWAVGALTRRGRTP